MNEKTHFTTVDIALIGVFSALWATLNMTIGRLGFTWFNLPIFCDFAVFFTLLLTVWIVGKFGAASIVGVIGAIIYMLILPSTHIIGFTISSVLFDALMLASGHRINLKIYDMAIAAIATAISAYFAGVVIGTIFMSRPIEWALTFWGGWHLIGGLIGVVVTLPIISVLERANVRRIKGVQ
ncbi:MAG: hypothetical protein C0193_01065 [Candidatus Bathyarchaeota archaeon]|nr:MAG: hypothetical protein C0193_01065 [Candidatus Bathyarchaeota archaeon]